MDICSDDVTVPLKLLRCKGNYDFHQEATPPLQSGNAPETIRGGPFTPSIIS